MEGVEFSWADAGVFQVYRRKPDELQANSHEPTVRLMSLRRYFLDQDSVFGGGVSPRFFR